MAPGDWTAQHYDDSFALTPPNEDSRAITVSAVPTVDTFNGDSVSEMPLHAYAALAANLELGGAGTINLDMIQTTTTRAGVRGEWGYFTIDYDDHVTPMSIVYFDLNETVDGYLYRTIQVVATGDTGLRWLNPIATSFNRGRQAAVGNEESGRAFRLVLPENWTIGNEEGTDYGQVWRLGAAPLDDSSSFIVVADAAERSVDDEIARLQALWIDRPAQTDETIVAGQPATRVRFIVDEFTYSEYFILERDGVLYTLHFQREDSPATRWDILDGFSFISR